MKHVIDKLQNWRNEINPRIEKLETNGFYLEAFFLYSAMLEFLLQETISSSEDWIAHLLSKSSFEFKKYEKKELEKLTLGQLIGIFTRYCKDKKLILKLNDFNSLRINFVHHILAEDPTQLNLRAKKHAVDYYELVLILGTYSSKIIKKLTRKLKSEIKNLSLKKR